MYSQGSASLASDGTIIIEADDTGPAFLSLNFSDGAANVGDTNFGLHRPVESRAGVNGERVSNSVEVFDAFGDPHVFIVEMTRVGFNEWNMSVAVDSPTASVISGEVNGILFNNDGSFRTSGTDSPEVIVQLTEHLPAQSIRINFGTPGEFDGISQTNVSNSLAVRQNGLPPGVLSDLNVSAEGTIQGIGSNGNIVPVAQIAVGRFKNVQGLEAIGESSFVSTLSSGEPLIGGGGSDGRGSVRASQLESSNVDLAQEFTRLIVAQRGFSANARTVTVTEEILE